MTKGELERLAILESQVEDIKQSVASIDDKLDRFMDALNTKADCTTVDKIRDAQQANDRSISSIKGALIFISAGIPVVLWIIEHFAAK